jgi:type IV secretion system protein TrbJ
MRIVRSAVLALGLVAGSTHAFVCPNIVFDPSAYMKNTIMAEKGIASTSELLKMFLTQKAQFETQTAQLQGRSSAFATQGAASLASASALLAELNKYRGTVADIKGAMTRRLDEIKSLGLNWEAYVKAEQERIDRKDAFTVKRVQEEIRLMDLAQREHAQVAAIGAQLSGSAGIHQAMQNLNLQTNMWITQNADLARIMASTVSPTGDMTELRNQMNERDTRRRQQMQDLNDLNKARRGAETDALSGAPSSP